MILKHKGKLAFYEMGYKLFPNKRERIKERVQEFKNKEKDLIETAKKIFNYEN